MSHHVQLYLVHNHHLHHLLNHQPSYHLDHLKYHYDHHCFPHQVLQSEFLNAVREVCSPVVLYYYSLLVFGNWCLFVLQYSSPLHLSWTKLNLQVYEHVYETVDVEGSPDIRLVNSHSICGFTLYYLSIIA